MHYSKYRSNRFGQASCQCRRTQFRTGTLTDRQCAGNQTHQVKNILVSPIANVLVNSPVLLLRVCLSPSRPRNSIRIRTCSPRLGNCAEQFPQLPRPRTFSPWSIFSRASWSCWRRPGSRRCAYVF